MTSKCVDYAICGIIAFLICVMLAFGIYSAHEYSQRDVYEKASYVCGTFGNLTSLTMTKNIWKLWNWQYESGNFIFKQRCPTFTHDAEIYNDGVLVSRTDGKIFNLESKYYIKDCHGTITHIVKTSGFAQTIINSNNIWTSLLLYTSNETLIAYIDADIFITGNVQLKNTSGFVIANIDKNIDGVAWSWTYQIFDINQITMETLVSITSKLSFMPRVFEKKDKTDMCNQVFLGFGITSLILLCIFVVAVIVAIMCHLRNKTNAKTSSNRVTFSE